MLDLTNVKALIETANGLPNGCYVDSDLYQHEQNTLFRDNCAAISFGKDLLRPDCVKASESVGLLLLLARNQDNEIKVFDKYLPSSWHDFGKRGTAALRADHLPFINPGLNSYSRLKGHCNIN